MSDIKISGFNLSYGEKIIFKDFDIAFEENKINVILGGSGVGKSSLLNAVAGIKEYSGTVSGTDGGVSYIFQKDRLIPTISVYKNLDLILKGIYSDSNERRKNIEEMLQLLEISDIKDSLPSAISGGQAQRVAIARAFLFPSSVLLLDEPFKALDTQLKAKLLKAFLNINEQMPRTVIYVTHAVDECLLSADKYFVLGGRPVQIFAEGEINVPKKDRNLYSDELSDTRNVLLRELFRD
ncbi:MAG: ATP-binding cassette domain-containing protein [Clostridia bacterium]|nr:ATP-binding cassette domain-containing protein [Clostridia bacterium]